MNKFPKIKGLTLIELVVAMGILAMVFAGTITLIIFVVNLAFSARLKTTAVALAQKKLTEEISTFRADPSNPSLYICPRTLSVPSDSGLSSADVCITPNPPVPSESGDFVMITVTVRWNVRGAPTQLNYPLSQVIRKSYL